MRARSVDLAQVRLDNALRLFEEFVRSTARHADAATLRGLERRFAERVQIQPSYWSQIKSRSRQIGERLARQFEQCCHKPVGWMDQPQDGSAPGPGPASGERGPIGPLVAEDPSGDAAPSTPRDDDERFIVGLVLTYYRRHPQRARTRLLDLLGEVLVPADLAPPDIQPGRPASPPGAVATAGRPATVPPALAEDAQALWRQAQARVEPLKPRRR